MSGDVPRRDLPKTRERCDRSLDSPCSTAASAPRPRAQHPKLITPRTTRPRPARPQVMTELVMDVLRALSSPSLDIRKKTLDLALELLTPRNIDEVRAGRRGGDVEGDQGGSGGCAYEWRGFGRQVAQESRGGRGQLAAARGPEGSA